MQGQNSTLLKLLVIVVLGIYGFSWIYSGFGFTFLPPDVYSFLSSASDYLVIAVVLLAGWLVVSRPSQKEDQRQSSNRKRVVHMEPKKLALLGAGIIGFSICLAIGWSFLANYRSGVSLNMLGGIVAILVATGVLLIAQSIYRAMRNDP